MALERVLLVRHDLSSFNNKGIIQGQTDTPLQPGYVERINRLAETILMEEGTYLEKSPQTDLYVFSSPLYRSYRTAESILHHLVDSHGYRPHYT